MGSRGSASGIFVASIQSSLTEEYRCVYKYKNITFIIRNDNVISVPLETMEPRLIYVIIGPDGTVNYIIFYLRDGRKYKQIDIDHHHHIDKGIDLGIRHVHLGYFHNENGTRPMTLGESILVEFVLKLWRNR